MQDIQNFNKQNMRTNLFYYKLLLLAFIFLGTKNFASNEENNYTSYIPHFKAIFGPLQYVNQICAARGCDNKFNRFFPCGGIMIYSPKIDYLYLEIGVGNYKDFRFGKIDINGINVKDITLGKIKTFFSSFIGLFLNKKETVKSDEKEYTKVFFARLGFSFNSPLNYLINNPLNASKIDILIEFPVRYNEKWFNVGEKGETTAFGGQVFTDSYYKNINIIIVPIRFINRSFSTRISLLKININDIMRIFLSNPKEDKKNTAPKSIWNNILYLFMKGFSAEFVFNFGSIVDTLLSRI